MSHRIFNFSAGPAMLPTEALEKSAAALLDFQGKGFGIAEVSHRGKEFEGVLEEATVLCKKLLGVGDSHDVVFLQGGATQLFTTIPMNFLSGTADYLVSGEWSKKAAGAAKDLGKVNVVASTEASNFDHSAPQSEWKMTDGADYFHVCTNETVHGHRLPTWPTHPNLIVDASSEFMSRPHPIGDCALVYGGAQKNLGPSGLVLAIVRKDLYPRQKKVPSKLWSFKDQAENKSMINTPPTFGVYILLEVFRWLDAKGGLAAMEQINEQKAKLIYDAVDGSNGFYTGTVSVTEQRSRMNVTYRLPSEELTDEFVKTAAKQNMVGLKGYRTVGGIRASIYNAMPVEGCQTLASFMKDFASKKS
ncbi:MAG TPA: 3-phosphoserine/phosphohydroxythreonine transaminase [Tepidisphaeraceae bacterium]|nr:3-phosphoserine/phosphohydroxythreonine transaminase [Tepidisphaeraceae bacterium]